MKNILITGSNGLLGQKIVHKLRNKKEARLVATSLGPNRISAAGGYLYESMDITDFKKTRSVIKNHAPEVIINTAALTNVNQCEEKKEVCRKINVDAVENMLEACQSAGIHFIQLSSDFVFDGTAGPYKETDPPNPLSFYAKSKYDSEVLCQKSSAPWSILRTSFVYGICEKMSHTNFVLWAFTSLTAGKPIRVITDQYRAPTLAEDLAEACIQASLREAAGIYHIGGPETQSVYELVSEAATIFKLDTSLMSKVTTAELKEPAPRPLRTGFILDKAEKALDYRPHFFHEGLALVKEQIQTIDYRL